MLGIISIVGGFTIVRKYARRRVCTLNTTEAWDDSVDSLKLLTMAECVYNYVVVNSEFLAIYMIASIIVQCRSVTRGVTLFGMNGGDIGRQRDMGPTRHTIDSFTAASSFSIAVFKVAVTMP